MSAHSDRSDLKTHTPRGSLGRRTECGRDTRRVAVTNHKPTCQVCLEIWRMDRFDTHNPATAGLR